MQLRSNCSTPMIACVTKVRDVKPATPVTDKHFFCTLHRVPTFLASGHFTLPLITRNVAFLTGNCFGFELKKKVY